MLDQASHKEIWALLRSGRQEALLGLYNKYYTGLMNYGLKLTGDRVLTNDCITQILLRLWDLRKKLPAVLNPGSYLLTCLRHELMAELRSDSVRAAKSRSFQRTRDHAEPSYEEYLIQLQTSTALKERLAKALKKLSQREKELLQLKFFEGLDYQEITSKCHITKRTAYNIIHAALKTLKAELISNYQPRYDDSPVIFSLAKLALALLLIFH
jgi:RNA polymerase sigma factor (sigma-70 family)